MPGAESLAVSLVEADPVTKAYTGTGVGSSVAVGCGVAVGCSVAVGSGVNDGAGTVVPPGIYIGRLSIDTQTGGGDRLLTVPVVY